MPSYKLYYFNVRGMGEMVRLAFAAGKIDYEDIRFDPPGSEQWAKEKASGRPPLGQMPFLDVDGKLIAQSGAICRYICREAGLSPTDSFQVAQADMIFDGVSDLRTNMSKFYFEADEAVKAKLSKEFFETTLPSRLVKFQKLLESNNGGKGFFVGDQLSYADITFFDIFNSLMSQGELKVPSQLDEFPLLVEHYNRIGNIPEIKAWILKRFKSHV